MILYHIVIDQFIHTLLVLIKSKYFPSKSPLNINNQKSFDNSSQILFFKISSIIGFVDLINCLNIRSDHFKYILLLIIRFV